MMEFTDAHSLVWANAQHDAVNMVVNFVDLGELPFLASPLDCEDHGRILFNEAVEGTFGAIAEYVAPPPPPEPTKAELLAELAALTARINALTE